MKNFFVRFSVLALAATGFAASTVASHAASKKDVVKAVVVGSVPMPQCPPGNGAACGYQ